MPRTIITVVITRAQRTPSGAGGYSTANVELTGSPFAARAYRRGAVSVDRWESQPGFVTLDNLPVLSILDPAAPVAIGDTAMMPDGPALISRVRRYGRHVQCDLKEIRA